MTEYPLAHANIVELLGTSQASLEERLETLEAAADLVEARVLGRILAALAVPERTAFQEALAAEDAMTVGEILQKANINLATFVQEEVEKVKEGSLEVAATAEADL